MNNSFVTVIIPFHNARQTIQAALDSALAQTYEELEIILIDDGSSDGSGELADVLASSPMREGRIVKTLHQEDLGVSVSRNRGTLAAEGGYITFLDADDTMDPGMIAYLMRLLRETGADIAGCGFQSVSAKKPPEEIPEPDAGEKIPHRLLQGSEIAREIIMRHDTRVWSKLFTRKTALSARFQEGLTIGEDMLYVLSCAGPETKYAAAAAPLYRYTVNPEGAMNRPFTRSYMDQLRCWELALTRIGAVFPELLQDRNFCGSLGSVQAVSAVLAASKISLLPGKERRAFADCLRTCRERVKDALANPDVRENLPAGYGAKTSLLLHAPALFGVMTRVAQNCKNASEGLK